MATTTFVTATRPGALAPAVPWLVAATLYLVLLVVGNQLLNDPDTYWHTFLGQWILTNGFPHSDPFSFTFTGQPWIAKEWLSQVLYFAAFSLGGWPAVVVLAAGTLALTFGLLTHFLSERLAPLPVVAFIAVAFMLVAPHAVARPHVLALPVMVAWVAGLVQAADRKHTPSYWLLPLMMLWANLHGGFTLGIFLIGAVGLDAIVSAEKVDRFRTALVWVRFGVLALVAACITPYGPESILVTWRVLSLGPALSLIGEWKPADFSHLGPLELAILFSAGFGLYRGVILPPVRILILLGLVHMALSAGRNSDVLGLLAPLFLMAPLVRQFPPIRQSGETPSRMPAALVTGVALIAIGATYGLTAVSNYRPNPRTSPAAAVAVLKASNVHRTFNSYDFGGYLIFAGVPTFVDGRAELYGGALVARAYRASTLADLNDLVGLLDSYRIDSTLLQPSSPAVAFLDTQPGWKRRYADDVAVIHVRR